MSKPTGPIVAVADKEMPLIKGRLLRAFRSLQKGVTIRGIMESWVRGGDQGVMNYIRVERLEKALSGLLNIPFYAGYFAEKRNLKFLLGIQKAEFKDELGFNLKFDGSNPEVESFLQATNLAFVGNVTNATRETIRSTISRAFVEGGNPRLQARQIRDSIGVLSQHEQAIRNFRLQLTERSNAPGGHAMRPAHLRRLFESDKRSVRQHMLNGTFSQKHIDEMVDVYQDRLIDYRAEMITRTETLRAAHAGQQALWKQATDEGLLPDTARRKWVFTKDERTRESHKAIPKLNAHGVKVGEAFKTSFGPVFHPPAGPNCRCTVVLDPDAGEKEVIGSSSPNTITLEETVRPIVFDQQVRTPAIVAGALATEVVVSAIAEEVVFEENIL